MNNYSVEHCWTLIGHRRAPFWYARRRRPVRGQPTEVSFDGPWALSREEDRGDVIGFYHTHPSGSPQPSGRDVRTMRAWASSLGKPLLCLIETDRSVMAWRFDNDRDRGTLVHAAQRLPNGIVLVYDTVA